MKKILLYLFEHKTLPREQAKEVLLNNSKGAYNEAEITAFITVYLMRSITIEELPAYYAKRTLLNETILPEDIANACYVFVSGLLNKSTGNTLNVDGGVAMAFLR